MPFERISAQQFANALRSGVSDRNDEIDVAEGDLSDTVIIPPARVFESVHERIRKLSLINTLANANEFQGVFQLDLEGIVFNEGLTRQLGSVATVTLTFSRSSAPTIDQRVQRGFPVATLADEASGQAITFVTTEERTMFVATASSYLNTLTGRYELSVPAAAVIRGSGGRAGPNRVKRALRPLAGFDDVTNPATAAGGRNAETNADLIRRYLLSIRGRELSTPRGIDLYTLTQFPDVEDVTVVKGADPLLVRAGDDAGAVDAYIIGEASTQVSENFVYVAASELIPVSFPPLIEVRGVTDVVGGVPLAEGVDYEVVFDDSGVGRSARASDGIRFLATSANLPDPGNLVTINYKYNALLRRLQTSTTLDDADVCGRDLLYRASEEVPMAHTANLRVASTFNTANVLRTVRLAVLTFINTLRGGADVEESDIQGVVRAITGVDNYITTRLSRLSVPAGTGDVVIEKNEHARIADTDYVVTLI